MKRALLFCISLIISFTIFAQHLSVEKRGNEYRLVSASGTPLTNYIFSAATVDTIENYAKVVYRRKTYLLNSDGRLIVPHAIDEKEIVANRVYADLTGPEATNNIYDLKGNILANHMKELRLRNEVKFVTGQRLPLFEGRSESDANTYIYSPNMTRICPAKNIVIESNYLIDVTSPNTRIMDFQGKVILSLSDNRHAHTMFLNQSSFEKKRSKYKASYSKEDFAKIGVLYAYDFKTLEIYTTDGQCIYQGRCSNTPAKQVRKYINKQFDKIIRNYAQSEIAYYNEKAQEATEALGTTKGLEPSASLLSINDYLTKHSPQHIFPILQSSDYDDNLAFNNFGNKLKQNKYGKISECKRMVDNSGLMYFHVKYANGKNGILDSKGTPIIAPTKHEILFSSGASVFFTFDKKDNERYCRQFYDWKGSLIMDLEKKGYEDGDLRFTEENLRFFVVQKNKKWGIIDYFGVLRVPIAFQDRESLRYTKRKTITYAEGDFYYDTSFSIPDTSRPGGKPSPAVKLPTEAQVQKEIASKKTEFYSKQRKSKYDACFSRYNSSSSTYDKQKTMEECLNYCDNDDQRGRVLNNIGVQYDARGDYATALQYFQSSAKLGCTTGKNNLDLVHKKMAQQQIAQQQAAQQQAKQNAVSTIMYGIADALNQAGQAIGNMQNNYQQSSNDQYVGTQNYTNQSSSQYKSNSSDNSGQSTSKKNTTLQMMQRDTDYYVYCQYDNSLCAMQTLTYPYSDGFKDSDRIEYQRIMKGLRLKWEKKGMRFTKSPREDWDGSL